MRIFVACLILISIQVTAQKKYPTFSLTIDNVNFNADSNIGALGKKISYTIKRNENDSNLNMIELKNISSDTIEIANLLPYGMERDHVYITGLGDHPLSRTHIFIPGKIPVNVVCPDNAWELGFACIEENGKNVASLVRRDKSTIEKGQRKRFETILYPGGSVKYKRWTLPFTGNWQEGLRLIFQKNMLFDIDKFDNSLFEREDLKWIRHTYVMHLIQAWDHKLYNPTTRQYQLNKFIQKSKPLYGGDDVIGIWPTWPSLGLDQRNQFDQFRDYQAD